MVKWLTLSPHCESSRVLIPPPNCHTTYHSSTYLSQLELRLSLFSDESFFACNFFVSFLFWLVSSCLHVIVLVSHVDDFSRFLISAQFFRSLYLNKSNCAKHAVLYGRIFTRGPFIGANTHRRVQAFMVEDGSVKPDCNLIS